MIDSALSILDATAVVFRWMCIVLGFFLLADSLTRVYYFYAQNHTISELRPLMTWPYLKEVIVRGALLVGLVTTFLDVHWSAYYLALYCLCVITCSFFPEVTGVDEDAYTVTLQRNMIIPIFLYILITFDSFELFDTTSIMVPVFVSLSTSNLFNKPVYRWAAYIRKHWIIFGPLSVLLLILWWCNTRHFGNAVFALSLVCILYPTVVYYLRKIPNKDLLDPKKI